MKIEAWREANGLELPASRHIPGRTDRPDDGFLEQIAAHAQPLTSSSTAAGNVAWFYGIRLLNEGYHWEAHEILEPVWMRARPNSRERFLVQALIHVANASLKERMDQPNAAARLLEMAAECLARAFPAGTGVLMGIAAAEASRILKPGELSGSPLVIEIDEK